ELFWDRLSALGYIEGVNLTRDQRIIDPTQLVPAAADLVSASPDIILAAGGPSLFAARAATSSIPIVFTGTSSPVERGVVVSLARPGGNITGFAAPPPEVDLKRMQLLVQAAPSTSMIALIGGTQIGDPGFAAAAAALGVQHIALPTGTPQGYAPALVAAANQGAD